MDIQQQAESIRDQIERMVKSHSLQGNSLREHIQSIDHKNRTILLVNSPRKVELTFWYMGGAVKVYEPRAMVAVCLSEETSDHLERIYFGNLESKYKSHYN